MLMKMTVEDHKIIARAQEVGCIPKWYDGIFGWSWHCGCIDHRHACDQQCSMLTLKSLVRGNNNAGKMEARLC